MTDEEFGHSLLLMRFSLLKTLSITLSLKAMDRKLHWSQLTGKPRKQERSQQILECSLFLAAKNWELALFRRKINS